MLAKRIIPCLDVHEGKVVKGVQFKNHKIIGEITDLAKFYSDSGADELVLYDISASSDDRLVNKVWIKEIAKLIDIPFCVAGGIRTLEDAALILEMGADKISINSPALLNPRLISDLSSRFGRQCVVVGIDSFYNQEFNQYQVYQFTGNQDRILKTQWQTLDWVREVQQLGAGEIVLNCMNQDGTRQGYDIEQLKTVRDRCQIPLIASGGAGSKVHFKDVFHQARVDGALAASIFHHGHLSIGELKRELLEDGILVRPEGIK